MNEDKRRYEEELSSVLDRNVFEILKCKLNAREQLEYSKVKERQKAKFARLSETHTREDKSGYESGQGNEAVTLSSVPAQI